MLKRNRTTTASTHTEEFTATLKQWPGLVENGFSMPGSAASYNGDKLTKRLHLQQFTTARDWLRAANWQKKEGYSYTLKHRAEESTGRYICNGALILAAYSLGLKVHREAHGGPSAWIQKK